MDGPQGLTEAAVVYAPGPSGGGLQWRAGPDGGRGPEGRLHHLLGDSIARDSPLVDMPNILDMTEGGNTVYKQTGWMRAGIRRWQQHAFNCDVPTGTIVVWLGSNDVYHKLNINFVSGVYGGNASDKQIVLDCHRVEPSD